MALKVQANFAAGELDPALHEQTTLEKYKRGLATLRNAVVGKTGRIISRAGRQYFDEPKFQNRRAVLFSVPFADWMIEWGHEYVRIFDYTGIALEYSHSWTEDDLSTIHFEASRGYIYACCAGKEMLKLSLAFGEGFVSSGDVFAIPTNPIETSITTGGTGYDVDYAFTQIINGQESYVGYSLTISKMPGTNEENKLTINCGPDQPTEVKVYRRPYESPFAGAFGYIGSTANIDFTAGNYRARFVDIGGEADYSHGPPAFNPTVPAEDFEPKTAAIYQQRLLLTRSDNLEAIEASRPGFQNNFYRDFPLDSNSALTFKAGTSGNADVLRMIDDDGLVVFTTKGIFTNAGALTPTNLGLVRKGEFVIQDNLPPLSLPGGMIFMDAATNTVRTLSFSTEAARFLGEELSIWSNHLFVNRKIVSWTFQDGDIPVVWVVFDDGDMAALTYQREHEMKAWSRHDSMVKVESATTNREFGGAKNVSYFLVERNGKRWIEKTTPRYVQDEKEWVGMDSTKTFNTLWNAAIGGGLITAEPMEAGQWNGILKLRCTSAAWTNVAGQGASGTVFTVFGDDGDKVELYVTEFKNTKEIWVQPSLENYPVSFPEEISDDILLYQTYTTLTGLDHLEGEYPMIHVDGNVISSPNNDKDGLPEFQVIGGQITLPAKYRGAFVHVGLPFVSDMETLDIDTVEQRPVLIESVNVNKLYVKLLNSKGLYVGNKFAKDDGLGDMEEIDRRFVNFDADDPDLQNVGNRPLETNSKRNELSIPGDWKSQGRICLRGVDGLPWEVLSIIPDMTDLRRRGN